MKIDWKTLCLANIFSIIITGVSGLILTLSNIIRGYPTAYESLSENLYDNKVSITIANTGNGPPYYFTLSTVIGIGLICITILTIVLYFIISLWKKRK